MAKKVISQQRSNGVSHVSVQQQTFEGPLPAPSDFAAYKDTLPSAPERILSMAEEEQEYRHRINNRVVKFGMVESILGMCFALLAVLSCIIASVYLALHNQGIVACALIGVVGTLAAIFYLKKEPTENK